MSATEQQQQSQKRARPEENGDVFEIMAHDEEDDSEGESGAGGNEDEQYDDEDDDLVSSLERPNDETVERMSRFLRELESRNLELERAIPRLKDAKSGGDITEWGIKIVNELAEEQRKHNKAEQNLAVSNHRLRISKDNAAEREQKDAKTIDDLKRRLGEYEEERKRFSKKLEDQNSMDCHLLEDGRVGKGRRMNSRQNVISGGLCCWDAMFKITAAFAMFTLIVILIVHVPPIFF
uniref:Uncharacterized protein n=1 Tax=Globodera rostochiensis TaxID=31243 RepID=A0A914HDQ3_GLORO